MNKIRARGAAEKKTKESKRELEVNLAAVDFRAWMDQRKLSLL